jgi:hypothetical protein
MCTLEEVVAYLYTGFFEFPPSQEWTREVDEVPTEELVERRTWVTHL